MTSAPTSASRPRRPAALVIVIGGTQGAGFSCQVADPALLLQLPEILEAVARDMRASRGDFLTGDTPQ